MSRRRLLHVTLEVWLPVGVVLAWWFVSSGSHSPFFPPLRTILTVFRQHWLFADISTYLVPSLIRFAIGLVLAALAGIALGVLLGLWPLARRAVSPTVDFLRAVPITTLASAFIVVLGFGHSMKVSFIAYASFFPILLNTIDGVRGVEPTQLEMARAYKLTLRQRIAHIILPGASPQIFAGLRVAVAVALLAMAFGEMVAGTDGIGFFVLFAENTYRIPDMWSGIILLGIVGYLVNLVFVAIERYVLSWHRGLRASLQDGH